jgi:hypothetical protein
MSPAHERGEAFQGWFPPVVAHKCLSSRGTEGARHDVHAHESRYRPCLEETAYIVEKLDPPSRNWRGTLRVRSLTAGVKLLM